MTEKSAAMTEKNPRNERKKPAMTEKQASG
jgi:hypothetical protein